MLSEKMQKALNDQIAAEMWSSNLYLSMSIHFAILGYSGFTSWLKRQSLEELEHAHKIIDYVVDRGGTPVVSEISVVPDGYGSALEIFEHVYEHEVKVSKMIDDLDDLALAENDKATQDFLRWFIHEQVEEESSSKAIVDKIRLSGGEQFLWFVDNSLNTK
ncbi:ferritin [Parabacteroides sp. Marseille-P3160]|uniref:ferritin n=1 Tax=Parabacteroides sp. Marseille-P3160 TaxID=1917887 RepID=UPI0009BB384F|nr:ferritin [Parabacteroides sp. Marseille-P3160]